MGLVALWLAWLALAQPPVPPLAARVNDLTATLTEAERQALEARLAAFEAEKGSQLAVLLVPSTRPESIEQYALRVAEAWRLGRKGVDDGILLLVAKDDRAVRIEVGYGLEGAVPDAVAKRIIEEVIVPRFRAADYYGGIEAGVEALIAHVAAEPLPPSRPTDAGGRVLGQILPLAMMFAFVLGGLLRALLGRLPGAGLAAALAFLGAWWLLGSVIAALIIALIAFFLTLTGVNVTGGYRAGGSGGRIGGWGGGGFSGGGGSFGGGGASGRW